MVIGDVELSVYVVVGLSAKQFDPFAEYPDGHDDDALVVAVVIGDVELSVYVVVGLSARQFDPFGEYPDGHDDDALVVTVSVTVSVQHC